MTPAGLRPRSVSQTPRPVTAWFTRRNYLQHRVLDPGGLPASFDEWLAGAEWSREWSAAALRVVIDPVQFATWCRAASRATDASARSDFAQVVAKVASRRDWWRRKTVAATVRGAT